MSELGSNDEGGIERWLDHLVSARHQHGAGGNRRRLFNRFDEIFASPVDWSALVWTSKTAGAPRPFKFKRLRLHNWKAFHQADFEFATTLDHPVALIGGNNGNGKTSFLEALALGIYGIRAHLDRSRLSRETGGTSVPKRSDYNQAIERAMHRQAFERGDRDMSVSIELETEDGPFELERRWYFGDDGSFVQEDEELVLRIGPDRFILSPPNEVPTADFAFFEIERRVAPVSMLPFLLFDGEQIRRLAQRELGEQVRFGLESALGVATIRALLEDLSDYARDRGKDVIADGTEASLSSQIETLSIELAFTRSELESIESELVPLRRRRDEIVKSIGSVGDGTYQERHADLELRKKLEAELQTARHDLLVAGVRLLPFLLMPTSLLDEVERKLDAAAHFTQLSKGEDARMLGELISALETTQPPLPAQTLADMARRTKEAWKISIGAFGEVLADPVHGYLKGHDARRVHDLIEGSRSSARSEIERMTHRIAQVAGAIAQMYRREEQRLLAETDRVEFVEELEDTSGRIAELEARRRSLDQAAGKLHAQIEPLQQDLDRRRALRRSVGHKGTGADAARTLINALQDSIRTAMPKHYEELASALTEAYRSLAHKGVVETVAIAENGDVSLLDSAGRDLRETEASAGEDQIFAMALIAAVGSLGGRSLPLVIDSPLGRLDTAHRERVLDYFVRRNSQTILLSQPEEVYGPYYERISHRIGSEHQLVYRSEAGGLGETVVEKGYFPRKAA
jgi:DNA sulfur modification protein DndD